MSQEVNETLSLQVVRMSNWIPKQKETKLKPEKTPSRLRIMWHNFSGTNKNIFFYIFIFRINKLISCVIKISHLFTRNAPTLMLDSLVILKLTELLITQIKTASVSDQQMSHLNTTLIMVNYIGILLFFNFLGFSLW